MKKRLAVNYLWYLLPVLLCGQNPQAQSYIADIRKISVEDGLSSRFVNTIHEDSRGFMWIGTQYGLNRYDGYEFKLYTAENSTLTSNSIKNIYEDNTQKLWIVHNNPYNVHELGNVDLLNLQTGDIQSFEQTFKNIAPFHVKDISDIHSDAENTIWISTKKGILYCYQNNRFSAVFKTSGEEIIVFNVRDTLASILIDRKKLLIINTQGQIIKRLLFKEEEVGGIRNTFWVFQFQQKKLLHFKRGEKKFQAFDLQPLQLPETIYDPKNLRRISMNTNHDLIWWYQRDTSDRFFVYHPREGIVFDLYPELMPLLTYTDLQVIDIYFDAEDRTWVATQDGIFIISLKKNKFTKLLSGTPTNYSARGIVEDSSGIVHINTYNGRMVADMKNRKTEKREETAQNPGAKNAEESQDIKGEEVVATEEEPLPEELTMDRPGLTVYPNPAQYQVNFRLLSEQTGKVSITLYDLTGRSLISTTDHLNGSDTLQGKINIASLPAGIYILEVNLPEGKSITKKIIKN